MSDERTATEPDDEMEAPRLRRDHGGLRSVFDEAMLTVKDDVLRLGALVESAVERAGRALRRARRAPSPTGSAGTTPR